LLKTSSHLQSVRERAVRVTQPFKHINNRDQFAHVMCMDVHPASQSVSRLTGVTIGIHLLGSKVEVESGLKSVELQLTRREKSSGSRGSGDSSKSGLVKSRLNRLSRLRLLETSLMTGQKTSLAVRGIEWVDEWVDTSAVGTGGNIGTGQRTSSGVLGGKLSSVGVVLEVLVGGVEWVDEGVEVGIDGLINIFIVGRGLDRLRSSTERGSTDRSSGLLNRGAGLACSGEKGAELRPLAPVGTWSPFKILKPSLPAEYLTL